MRTAVIGMKTYFDRGMEFLFRLIDECPDDLWKKKGGGFFYWQQVYHAFYCVDYFLLPPESEMADEPFGRAVAMFSEIPASAPSKETVRKFGVSMKKKADEWIAFLNDEFLGLRHDGMSVRRKAEMNNGAVFVSLCGHTMYHVGCLDSVLREHGLKGVY